MHFTCNKKKQTVYETSILLTNTVYILTVELEKEEAT